VHGIAEQLRTTNTDIAFPTGKRKTEPHFRRQLVNRELDSVCRGLYVRTCTDIRFETLSPHRNPKSSSASSSKTHCSKCTRNNGNVRLYRVTIATHAHSAALSSQTGPAYSLGHSPSQQIWTLTCSHTAIRSQSLPFNKLQTHSPCKYIDYYSFTDPRGMEGWVGLVGWPIEDTLPTKWSPVNHRLGARQ